MAKLIINTGSAPNDGAGDSLRDGADKINANFLQQIFTTPPKNAKKNQPTKDIRAIK